MSLYGIYGEHAQDACLLYNEKNRKFLLANIPKQEKNTQMYKVKILNLTSSL